MFCKVRKFQEKPVCATDLRCKAVMSRSVFYQPQTIDLFTRQKHVNPDGLSSIRMTSDVYMLFNQRRLDRMTREMLIDHFNQMSPVSNDLASLRSKLSDDQLVSIVKSRYIQSPSELLRYSSYLNSLADSEIQSIVSRMQQQIQQQQQKHQEVVSPAPAAATE